PGRRPRARLPGRRRRGPGVRRLERDRRADVRPGARRPRGRGGALPHGPDLAGCLGAREGGPGATAAGGRGPASGTGGRGPAAGRPAPRRRDGALTKAPKTVSVGSAVIATDCRLRATVV